MAIDLLTEPIPSTDLDKLDSFAREEVGPQLRDVVFALTSAARDGARLAVSSLDEALTPNQVATRLGMSRTHLYKLLDRGEIPSHYVGRDRRIRVRDLVIFEQQRQADRRELAERFAHRAETRSAAIDELITAM